MNIWFKTLKGMGTITVILGAYLVFIAGLNVWQFGFKRLFESEFLYNFQIDLIQVCATWVCLYIIVVIAKRFGAK
ncbi:hypothetical protein [Asticcacaulis sp. W401b]|uniref:hypothetical protein n=1 Tax=Asticcacaulis sp. W401b TaxID=3388666 RepID=UPI003970AA16